MSFASVVVTQNSFHGNHGLAIVLGPAAAISPNSPGSPFNFPFVTSVTTDGTSTTFGGLYAGPPNRTSGSSAETLKAPTSSPERRRPDVVRLSHVMSAGPEVWRSKTRVFGDLTAERIAATATTVLVPLAPEGGSLPTIETSEFSQRLPFSIVPRSGPGAGGNPVTVAGTSFDPAAILKIGGAAAGSVIVSNAGQITATTPALAPGAAYDVSVTNPDLTRGTIALGFVADFLDVPPSNTFTTT